MRYLFQVRNALLSINQVKLPDVILEKQMAFAKHIVKMIPVDGMNGKLLFSRRQKTKQSKKTRLILEEN